MTDVTGTDKTVPRVCVRKEPVCISVYTAQERHISDRSDYVNAFKEQIVLFTL